MDELVEQIGRAKDGDLAAYGDIVRRFQDMAYGCAYAVLSDFHLAEDVAQEAFVEAYRKLSDLREPKAFPGWFRRIVLGQCNRVTRKKDVPTVPLDAAAGVSALTNAPDVAVQKMEMKDKVLSAIQSLPDGQRMATTLFYINGYSQNEVADFLEVPVSTVKKRLHDSRRKLKERMMDMVADTLKENVLDERFSAEVIDRLVDGPNLLAFEGHPMKGALDAIVAALPEYQVVRPLEFVAMEHLPEMVLVDMKENPARVDAFRHPEKGMLRHWPPMSTLQAVFGGTPPMKLVNPERLFMPGGWREAPSVKVGHVIDVICVGKDVTVAYATETLKRAIMAVYGDVELRVNWAEDDDSVLPTGGYPRVVRRGVDFLVLNGDDWSSVARGGMLSSQALREMGYDPNAVACAHIGIGGERIVLAKLGLRLEDIGKLWQPPYVPEQ